MASWLPYNDSRKWPNTESLPLTSLLRTMRSHTLQSDWSARHSPANVVFGVLDITMYHCAHQHVLVGAEGGHDTSFSPLTPLCVWFWGVVIQGHSVSSHDPQIFLQCPLFFDLYVPFQHSCLFHPCMNLYQNLLLQICSSESSSHFNFRPPSS